MLETMSNSYILQILLIEYVLMTGILAFRHLLKNLTKMICYCSMI